MLKKFFLIVFVFSLFFLVGCKENSDADAVVDPNINSNSVTLSGNVKNSSIYFDLNNKSEITLPDIIIKKVVTQYSSYPEFSIYNANLGNGYLKILMTDQMRLSDITKNNFSSYTLSYDTTIGKNWYYYNPTTHTLSPRANVYLLKNAQDNIVKFKISNYNDNKLTFVYSIKYQDSSDFSKIDSIVVDGNNSINYLSFQKGLLNTSNQLNWDLKFTTLGVQTPFGIMKYPGILLNNAKGVKATFADNVEYSNILVNQYVDQLKADLDTNYAIGMNCFKYDENSHKLNPYDKRVFVIRSYNGNLFKMKLLNYYNNLGKSGYITFEYNKQ